MPYIPPHLRPGYVPKYTMDVARHGVHFPSNALNATNTTSNFVILNELHTPTHRHDDVRSILKKTSHVSPNATAIVVPTNNIMHLPPKYRDMLLARGVKSIKSKSRKSKKTRKSSSRRRKTNRGTRKQ